MTLAMLHWRLHQWQFFRPVTKERTLMFFISTAELTIGSNHFGQCMYKSTYLLPSNLLRSKRYLQRLVTHCTIVYERPIHGNQNIAVITPHSNIHLYLRWHVNLIKSLYMLLSTVHICSNEWENQKFPLNFSNRCVLEKKNIQLI